MSNITYNHNSKTTATTSSTTTTTTLIVTKIGIIVVLVVAFEIKQSYHFEIEKMSLYHCFNPACGRGFNTSKGVQIHMQQNEYAAKTIMCASSDESDSETDCISPEIVGENNNNIDINDNFSIDK